MNTPNILYILADDLGWGDISLHGSPIRTPHIDQLAREGIELTQHYVCPMCTPTRASLLTGRHPSRFGAHATTPSNAPVLPDDYETLATVLRDAGYDRRLPALSGLGYRQLWDYLVGEMSLEEAVERVKFETHRFARQQATWFRQDDPAIKWFDMAESGVETAVLSYIRHWLTEK